MNATVLSIRKSSPWVLIGVLAVLAAAALWFLKKKVHYYVDFSSTSYSDYYWPRRAGLIPHVFGGLVAISAGMAQVWLGLTNRIGRLHRTLGKVYATGVLVGVLGGTYVALNIPPGNLSYQVGLLGLCLAWAVTTGMALWAIRNRRFDQHRDWMLRSYVVTFAFVTFRLFADGLAAMSATHPSITSAQIDSIMAWASWAFPLLIAEPFIQARAVKRRP